MKYGRQRALGKLAEMVVTALLIACVGLFVLKQVVWSCPVSPWRKYELEFFAVSRAIESFRSACGAFPAHLQELIDGQRGSGCVVGVPMKFSVSHDHWGSPYLYSVSSDGAQFHLRSAGGDRRMQTADDINSGDPSLSWRGRYDSVDWVLLLSTLGTVLVTAFALLQLSSLLIRGGGRLLRILRRQRLRDGAETAGPPA